MTIPINEIQKYLSMHNVKASYPRLRIFEYLVTCEGHPTVDDIYQSLIEQMPTLSKTTVYNTLELFVKKGVAKIITIEEENEMRYDADTTNHGHFKCVSCNIIFDFDIDPLAFDAEGLSSFQIDSRDVYYKGICEHCLNSKPIE